MLLCVCTLACGFAQLKQTYFGSIEEALDAPLDVHQLNLNNKVFCKYFKVISKFPNLVELNLYGNQISVLPKEIAELTNVKILTLQEYALSGLSVPLRPTKL